MTFLPVTVSALQSCPGGGTIGQGYADAPRLAVRRLMPVEAERLMGWPDDSTRLTHDDRVIPDTHRYRLIGNGVVTPVAAWIATRLRHVLENTMEDLP